MGSPVDILVSGGAFRLCQRIARHAEIGGRSRISAGEERAEYLSEDQLVGQLGTYAAVVQLCGSARPYVRAREIANADPTRGDGGSDVPGTNLDVKTSLARVPGREPEDYYLIVRPAEMHRGWVYVLALVVSLFGHYAVVSLVGWAATEDFPGAPVYGGEFSGAYVLPGRKLNPIPPVRWPKVEYARRWAA